MDYMSSHRIQTVDPLRILLKLRRSIIEHIAESFQEVGSIFVWEALVGDYGVRYHIFVHELVPSIPSMHTLASSSHNLIILPTQQSHAMISNILILVTWNRVRCLASRQDSLVPHPAHTDEEYLLAAHRICRYHFLQVS